MNNKYNINSYLIMYLIGYSFYFHQIYTQILYPHLGLEIVIPFSICYLLVPFLYIYIFKKLKYKINIKVNFIFKILSIIYFLITSLIVLNYVSIMIHNYYYQDTSSLIVSFFLLIPLLYVTMKNSSVYYSLTFIITIIFIGFKLLYGLNPNTFDIYPLYNTLKITNYWQVILISLPILIEPIVLLSNKEMLEDKINLKLIIPAIFIISIISILNILRQTSEFGLLLKVISFPYYESCKLISFESNFDNIDYYYLFSLNVSIFSRIPFLFFTIKDSFKIKNKYMLLIFIFILVCLYFLLQELKFYLDIIMPLFYISSLILISLVILSLFIKGEKKNAS